MSASTVKKNRQVAKADGTDKRTVAQRKEAEKKAKEKVKWTLIGILVVLFIAAVMYLNSGMFYRNTVALKADRPAYAELGIEAASEKFSIAEVNYAYNSQLVTMLNNMGEYTSLYGLNTQQPLKSQECSLFRPSDLEEGVSYTWDDYFKEAAHDHLVQISALCAYANANGIALSEEDIAEIDESMAGMDEIAKGYGYGNANKFFSANYGTGCNVKLARVFMLKEMLAQKVLTTLNDSYTFTQAELDSKYDSVKDSYDTFDYDFYLVNADKVETPAEEEDGEPTSEVTDETMAAAKEKADAILALLEEGKDFTEALTTVIPEVSFEAYTDTDGVEHEAGTKAPEVSAQTDITGSSLESAIEDWMLSADRKEGDKTVIESSGTGYYVVVFGSRDNNKHTTEESGDMNYCDYVADSLLRNEKLTDWEETVFTPFQEIYSLTDCFAIKYVGR